MKAQTVLQLAQQILTQIKQWHRRMLSEDAITVQLQNKDALWLTHRQLNAFSEEQKTEADCYKGKELIGGTDWLVCRTECKYLQDLYV